MKKPLPVTGYTYTIYPDEKQKITIFKTMISCKHVYNDYLKIRRDSYTNKGKNISYFDCVKDLPKYIREHPATKHADSQALRSTLKQLDNDYVRFFKTHRDYPKFITNESDWRHYKTINNGSSIELHPFDIKLPKLGRVSTVDLQTKDLAKIIVPPPGRILSAVIRYSDNTFTATLYFTTQEAEKKSAV